MANKNIEFLRILPLRGPNFWTYRPALEAWVDIGELEDFPSNTLPGFPDRLAALLPSLIEHHCSVGERGGFMQRVREGTWAAHILEHVTLELQNLAGQRTGFGKARSTSRRGVYKVVVRSRQEEVSRACLSTARELLLAAIEDRPFDVSAALAQIRDIADRYCLGPSTACIVDAATERRIPAIRLTDGNLVQLGYGARQRRIWTAETDRTSAIGETISRDKDLTKRLLESCGVPIPEGRIVDSPAAAWEAAEDIGLPIVVKPSDGNHGRGVSTELRLREEVEAAYALADEEGSEVIVERFIPGNEHRLLVVGGRMVAAGRGETAWITGDGRATVLELIDDQLNGDPRRGITEDYPLNLILIDEDPAVRLELTRQGLEPTSVPAAGQRVLIQRNGNVAFDVTDEVHPEVAAAAALAARIVGLDIAGVDVVAEDIGQPLATQRGAIVEVNAGPGLLMHLKPAEGKPRPVGRAIVDHLFPNDDDGRIPVIGITGSHGRTTIAHLLARLMHLDGKHVGLACADGSFVNRRRIDPGDCTGWQAGQRVLMNRSVEAAVLEVPARTIVGEGLAYDRARIAIVTGIDAAQALPEFYVETAEQLFNVMRTVVDVVLPDGAAVLNATDPLVADMAPLCDGEVLFYGTDGTESAIVAHRQTGGRAVFLRGDSLVLAQGNGETVLPSLAALRQAKAGLDLQAVVAAAAAAWALGIGSNILQAGIEAHAADLA
jgi:cyanophycin synthetase